MTDLPTEMVERSARILFGHDRGKSASSWDKLHHGDRENYRTDAREVLAIAMYGCEVREEWVVLVDGPPTVGTVVMDADESREYIEAQVRDAGQYPRTLGRRLVITTAPEPVESGGGGTA